MQQALRILHLENDPRDAELVRAALAKGGFAPQVSVAATREAYLEGLDQGGLDLILSDSGLPGFDGPSALAAARQRCPRVPFIVVSGAPMEELRRRGGRGGADEVVSKAGLDRLAPTIQRALLVGAGKPEALPPAERLVAVVQELSLVRDLPALMAIVRLAARELTGADGATFVLRDGDQCHYADEDAIAPLWKGCRFPMEACISGWSMLNKQAVAIPDIYADPRIPADAYRPTFVKSLAMVPIRSSAPIGAIGNYWARHHQATPEELRLLQALADSTSIAMENLRLYEGLERRVEERTAQLEAALKELESFSYSVSHDLRAPVRAVDGFGQLLKDRAGASLDPKSSGYLQHILEASRRMGELIEDLLQLSRVTRADLVRRPVDLSRMALEVAEKLRAAHPARPVELSVEPGLSVDGDPSLLRAVLENLLGNAWKYTGRQAAPQVAFGHEEAEGGTCYFVRDNGAGFDMAYVDRLFGAFQRLHSEQDFPGHGVGLATVQRILRRHGGRIWAEGAVDQGATFRFTLP